MRSLIQKAKNERNGGNINEGAGSDCGRRRGAVADTSRPDQLSGDINS